MSKSPRLETRNHKEPSKRIVKTDEELRIETGTDTPCKVLVLRPATFLLDRAKRIKDSEFAYMMKRLKKEFWVHYGIQFLKQIADYAYRSNSDYLLVDLDKLYSTYITSQFTSLSRVKFKRIIQSFFMQWQNEFNQRRKELIVTKEAVVKARRKAMREASKRCRIIYKNSVVIVQNSIRMEAKKALQAGLKCKVMLKPICVDDSHSCTSGNLSLLRSEISDSRVEEGMESEDSIPIELGGDSESAESATFKLLAEMVEKTSLEFERSGFCAFREDSGDLDMGNESEQTIDCDSDDTVESPMEEEFVSGESPDFSKVLQVSQREELGDSEETCHVDDFVAQSRSSYTCDTDQSNSGLPQENGQGSDDKLEVNHSDEAGGNNRVIKQAIRSQNQSIVVVPMKL